MAARGEARARRRFVVPETVGAVALVPADEGMALILRAFKGRVQQLLQRSLHHPALADTALHAIFGQFLFAAQMPAHGTRPDGGRTEDCLPPVLFLLPATAM